MRRTISCALALLVATILAVGARPVSADSITIPCTNPYTGQSYCDATAAILGNGITCFGFCGDLDFFRRTTGFITPSVESCLCSAAVNALSSGTSSDMLFCVTVANNIGTLEQQLLAILGSPVSPSGAPLLLLPLALPGGAAITGCATDPVPCPTSSGGAAVLTDCFIPLRCRTGFTCSGQTFATTCAVCEQERRLIARTLAFDLECARIFALAGDIAFGSNGSCTGTCGGV
jgi:hypothetical protein